MTITTIFSGAGDGRIQSHDVVYATANAGSNLATDTASAQFNEAIGQYISGTPDYVLSEFMAGFDTSAVPAGQAIVGSVVSLYGAADASTQDFTIQCVNNNWGSTLTTADWVPSGSFGALLASLTSAGWNTAGYNDLVENGNALSAMLNLSGTTYLTFVSNRQGTTPVTAEVVGVFSADQAGTTQDPKLVVTTTVNPPAIARPVQIPNAFVGPPALRRLWRVQRGDKTVAMPATNTPTPPIQVRSRTVGPPVLRRGAWPSPLPAPVPPPAAVSVPVGPGLGLRAEVYDSSDNKLNVGPLLTWLSFGYKLAFDQMGSWSGSIPAASPGASSLQEGYELRFYREGEGLVWRSIIDRTAWHADPQGEVYALELSGLSIAEQLGWLSVNTGYVLSAATPAAALSALLAGTGWTSGTVDSSGITISLRLDGLSRWEAIVRVAQYFGMHVREDNLNKRIDMGVFGASSGLVFANRDHAAMPLSLNANLLPIAGLTDVGSIEGLWNRVQVLGGGDGWAQTSMIAGIADGSEGALLSYIVRPFGYVQNATNVDEASFEYSPWDADTWIESNASPTQVSSPVKEGSYALQETVSASSAWNVHLSTGDPNTYFPGATAGLRYKGGMWVAGVGTGIGKSVFLRMEESGGAAAAASTDSSPIVLSSAFQYIEVERTLVQNDRTVVTYYLRSNGSEAAGDVVVIDMATFWRRSLYPYAIQHANDLQGNVYTFLEDSASVAAHGKRECVIVLKDVYPTAGTQAGHLIAAKMIASIGGAWLGRRNEPSASTSSRPSASLTTSLAVRSSALATPPV